jgi:dCMP deaminase
MAMAHILAMRGTCDRAQVGALIVRDGRIIGMGYNGSPPGLPHCEENNHGWYDAPHHDDIHLSCRNATHAEANALAFSAKYGVSTDEAELIVTLSPCVNCSRLLIAAGICRVVYATAYRDTSGLDILYQTDVQLVHLGIPKPTR